MAGAGVSFNYLVPGGTGILSLLQQGISVIEVIMCKYFFTVMVI